jgi:hypothetical protein
MADILIEPSSTSVESVSEFVKRLQGLVTSAVTTIDQASKTADGYANRSRRDFQFGVGDVVLIFSKYFIPEAFRERRRKLVLIYERENKPCFSLEPSHIQFINYSLHIVDIFHISCHDYSIVITSLVSRTTHVYSNTMCRALLLIIACVYRHLTVF